MRGYVSCERCGWSRIYARYSIARLPTFCPACGRRVIIEHNPTKDSPTVAHWQAVAQQLAARRSPRADKRPG